MYGNERNVMYEYVCNVINCTVAQCYFNVNSFTERSLILCHALYCNVSCIARKYSVSHCHVL